MTTTDNYGLKKPSGDDRVNVQDFNDNMDTLDSVVKTISDKAYQSVTWDDVQNKPSSMPASDVHAWAKSATKPQYTYAETGADASGAAALAETNANTYTDNQVLVLEGEIDDKLDASKVGVANGVASLDANGLVPSSQLPSYVDDVVEGYRNPTDGLFYEESTYTTAITGETGKIYVDLSTEKTYRWSGSLFVEISESLALGETSSTAYRGDRGKTAYDHSQLVSGNPHNVTASDVGLGNVPNVTTNNQEPTFTEASTRTNIASGETLATILGKVKKFFTDLKTVAFTGSYNDLTDKPTIGTVNDATLTIKKNGTAVDTFTANASVDKDIDISVPTKVSDLTNDSGFITSAVTSVATGAGLTGGPVTSTGTVKANLKSEAASVLGASSKGSTADREYAVGVDKDGYLSVNIPWENDNTQYSNGVGLAMSGTTIKADLKSETASALTAASKGSTTDREYAVGVDADGHLSVNVPWTDTNDNTTYSFTSGTNKFTVTPSVGTAFDVNVTPSIANNITGTGTAGSIAKFDGANGITSGPAIGSGTTKFLREDGTWQEPSGGGPVVLSNSLAADATSLSFTNAAIGDNTRFDVYTSVYGVNPTNMAQSGTTLTLTFPSSHVAATIKVHCWN